MSCLDIKMLGRFGQSGNRTTVPPKHAHSRSRGAGGDCAHFAVDDATWLAYVEVLEDERKESSTGFLLRVLHWLRGQSIRAERFMTDNGCADQFRRFGKPSAFWTSATSPQG